MIQIPKLSETATLELEGPDGEALCVVPDETNIDPETGKPRKLRLAIKMLSITSDDAQRFRKTRSNERLRKASKRGKLAITQEQLDADALDLAVFCTRGWDNFLGPDNKPHDCTAPNVRELYANPEYAYLYEQVTNFIATHSNFAGNA